MPVKTNALPGSADFINECKSFALTDADSWIKMFDGQDIRLFSFGVSPKLSCYLFSIIAGPYETIESDDPLVQNYRFPLRLHCRKSLTKWVLKAKEEYFNVTRCGIDYYEKLFSTKYPFAKLD